MCGIVGIVNRGGEPASPVLLNRMGEALRHRGPDGDGVWTEGPVGFAHRRLAIIDLTPAGHQPMQTPDGRFTITYNGEVYNFQELRLELEARGRQFRSRTDTEVVLAAFAEWGLDAILRFNGIFALAIHDRERRETVLVRDRFGVKPLYWAELGSTLVFASEIKAFIAHPGFGVELDPEALVEYLTFQNFLTERTLFRGVRLLPAGTWMRVPDNAARPVETTRYWDFRFADPVEPGDRNAAIEELDRLFAQAVGRQLVGDVPVGSYLSGGMDSASITALAARQLPDLRTFTVGFDLSSASGLELAFDERQPAERVSYLCRTEHYEMVLKAGDMERCMRQLVWHVEEPRVGQSYPNFYAAKLASKFGKVVLSGAGGDELFGGYPWRYYRAAVNTGFDDYVGKYYGFWQRLLPADATPGIFRPLGRAAEAVDPVGIFRGVFGEHPTNLAGPEDYINHSLYFEAKTFLHGLLVIEDKLSMAHGLESRLPFLDNDLVDFAMRTPVAWKLGNLGEVVRLNENEPGSKTAKYFQRTRDGKLILREAMARLLPREVAEAPKQGFSAPDASWFRGESIDYVRRLLGRNAAIYDWLDRGVVERLVDDHLEGRENRRLLIWSLLCLETWCDVFLGGGGRAVH